MTNLILFNNHAQTTFVRLAQKTRLFYQPFQRTTKPFQRPTKPFQRPTKPFQRPTKRLSQCSQTSFQFPTTLRST
jgi:hypothetical protein